jgi:hypothetical protein
VVKERHMDGRQNGRISGRDRGKLGACDGNEVRVELIRRQIWPEPDNTEGKGGQLLCDGLGDPHRAEKRSGCHAMP